MIPSIATITRGISETATNIGNARRHTTIFNPKFGMQYDISLQTLA